MNKELKNGNSRRSFLRNSSLSFLGLSLPLSVAKDSDTKAEDPKKSKGKYLSLFKREYETIDDAYTISPDYKRMDQKNIIFSRGFWDPKMIPIFKSMVAKKLGVVPNPLRGRPGFTRLDHALAKASLNAAKKMVGFRAMGVTDLGPLNNWDYHTKENVHPEKHRFESPEQAAKHVKKAAKFFGASVVGIAPYDERWTYSKWYDATETIFDPKNGKIKHVEAKLPFEIKSVIALGHEMDYESLTCPGELNEAATQKGYAEMAEVGFKVADFLNSLGYKAIPAGNDIGMSIPIAVQAGLGENSRMGTLINEEYGSRLRLSKIYTNLEIKPDKPVSFGVYEFCKKCKKCAESCPSNSISMETEPTMEPTTGSISSHPGVKKWYQNNETCIAYWEKQGGGCSVCISVCPYNKMENWVHNLSEMVVSAPVGRDIARQMDDAFGYGKITDENAENFWNNKE